MSFLSSEPFDYGSDVFTQQLRLLGESYNWVPYEDIHSASMDIFAEKYGRGRVVLAQFLAMVIDQNSTSKQAMAGWYLLYSSIRQKRDELIAHGCDLEGQYRILTETYAVIVERHKFAFYQIEHYFNSNVPSICNNYKSTTEECAPLP